MRSNTLENAFERIDFDRELVFKFFIVFSLFEYALKAAGIRKPRQNAEPDWDQFTDLIEGSFDQNKSDELINAVTYILNDPPMQQMNNNGQMNFDTLYAAERVTEIRKLSLYIRRVRNNLFHGGKFRYERPRDTLLIQSSIVILEVWASLNEGVRMELENVV